MKKQKKPLKLMKNPFRFQKLNSKLISMILVLLIIPSFIIGISGWQIAKGQLNQQSQKMLQAEVKLVNQTIKELDTEVKAGLITKDSAQEQIKEMILGAKEANGHRPINHSYNLGKDGYFFILNDKGVEVAHPSIEGKSIWKTKSSDGVMVGQQIVKKGMNGGGYTTFVWPLPNSNQAAKKIVYSEKDPAGWGWIVVAGSYMKDYNAGANKILKTILIIIAAAVVLGILFGWLFSRRITKPIEAMEIQLAKVTAGDLTVDELNIRSNDEIGRLAKGFNNMIANLRLLITQIIETAEQVAASSQQLSASSQESSQATEQVAATIQTSAEDTQRQTDSIEEGKQSIQDLTQGVRHIAENSSLVSNSAGDASAKTLDGNESVKAAVQQMNDIHSTVNGLSGVVRQLGDHSNKIGQIVDTITNIATQTNLLALNAAIEAARAGDSGKGFAVVADEVRKLAEESAHSAEQIANIIGDIQQVTKHAVSETENTTTQVTDGLEAVNAAGRSFDDIQKSIETVRYQIQEVSAAAEQLSAGAGQLNTSIDDIAQISERTSDSMQTVSASAEEQLAASEEINASAASLTKIAENLQEVVNKFHI